MRRRWATLLRLVTLTSAPMHLLPGSSPPLRDSISRRCRCRLALVRRGSPSLLPLPCQTLLRCACWSTFQVSSLESSFFRLSVSILVYLMV
ncbi:hypothetical protein AHAS_Ahas03G0182100 [Arachis hypogaea]